MNRMKLLVPKTVTSAWASLGLLLEGRRASGHPLAISILIIFLFGFLPSTARATTIYQYTGSPFNIFINGGIPGGTSVSGQFSLSTPLASNMSLTDISGSILAFSFTDGVNTITNLTSPLSAGFEVATDAGGNINDWSIGVHQLFPTPVIAGSQEFSIGTSYAISDYGLISTCTTPSLDGKSCDDATVKGNVSNVSGTWSLTVTPVPEPSAFVLLGVGLVVLTAWGKRKADRY